MRALILAAGRGVRLRPWTFRRPKPLLRINGKPLIQYQVERLYRAGIRDLVINHGYLGEQVEGFLKDGGCFGVRVRYSREGPRPLGTGAGVRRALKLLGREPFLIINADLWHDYPLERLCGLNREYQARLVLVPNPPQHPQGDFSLRRGKVTLEQPTPFTYAGLALCRPSLFRVCPPRPRFDLAPLLRAAATAGRLQGELHRGVWVDLGAPERLIALRRRFSAGAAR